MNKTEESFFLKYLKDNDNLASVRYERLRFILAPGSTWTPDFFVVDQNGNMAVIEIKGRWRADDRIQIKVAADLFPEFHFFGVQCTTKKIIKVEAFGVGTDPEDLKWILGSRSY